MPPPFTILYPTTSGQVGGAERCLASLTAGLDPRQFQAQVLIGSPGPLADILAAQSTAASTVALPAGLRSLSRYHRNPGGLGHAPLLWQASAYLWRLRRAGLRLRPHLVHSNGLKMHYFSALLQPAWGVPLIWHLHDFPARARDGSEPWANRPLRWLSARPAIAIANSRAVADAHAASFPRLAPKLRVVPNGVAVDRMQRARADGEGAALRRSWGFQPGDFVVGMVAIFAPWKGHEIFLRAAGRLRQQIPTAKFVLVGDDIYDTAGHGGRRRELDALARELGLGEAVRFAGFLGEGIAAAYAALDVMVHASTEPEPFGRTAIEAMAAGTPVVAAAAGGMVDIVQDGDSGLLTPPGDVAALAAALARLHANPALRLRLAEAGLRRVRQRFSEEVVGRAVAAIYAELLEGR